MGTNKTVTIPVVTVGQAYLEVLRARVNVFLAIAARILR